MTQAMDFLVGYAGELAVLWGAFVTVFLFVILHRMRKITKLMQGIAGNIKEMGQALQQTGKEQENRVDSVSQMKEQPRGDGQADVWSDALEQATVSQDPKAAEQQKLISAVLDEVFP